MAIQHKLFNFSTHKIRLIDNKYLKLLTLYIYFTYNYILLYWAYVLYTRGWADVPCPLMSDVVAPSCDLSGHVGTTR